MTAEYKSALFEDSGGWPAALARLFRRENLDAAETARCFGEILAGRADAAHIAAFVAALRTKGETVEEIAGCVAAMRDHGDRVELDVVAIDTCGTGGDRAGTINVSTVAALIAAACGAYVCKHGNRAASSRAGSADVLEALGVAIELGPAGVASCVHEAGIGFCFAPRFHPAMRHAGVVRRELGVATIFNFLGPLANPARVTRQAIGVSDPTMAEKMLGVLEANGAEHAMIYFGHDGLDELTTVTSSTILVSRRADDGSYTRSELEVEPRALGLAAVSPEMLRGGSAEDNAERVHRLLAGERGPQRDLVLLNAAAALMVADLATDLAGGMALGENALDSGAAAATLERLTVASVSARASGLI